LGGRSKLCLSERRFPEQKERSGQRERRAHVGSARNGERGGKPDVRLSITVSKKKKWQQWGRNSRENLKEK